MDISSIVYAALGGALVAGVGGAFASKFLTNQTHRNIAFGLSGGLVVLGSFVLTSLYKNMYLPRFSHAEVNEAAEFIPYLQYIKGENPKAYKDIIYPLDKMLRNNNISSDEINIFRQNLDLVIQEKRQEASARTLRNENLIANEMYEILQIKAPHVCTQKFFGRPYERLDTLLDDEYQKKEEQMIAAFFIDQPRSPNYKPDLARGKKLFDEILPAAIEKWEIEEIDPPISNTVDNAAKHQKICELLMEINEQSSAQTDTDMLHLMSYLASL